MSLCYFGKCILNMGPTGPCLVFRDVTDCTKMVSVVRNELLLVLVAAEKVPVAVVKGGSLF